MCLTSCSLTVKVWLVLVDNCNVSASFSSKRAKKQFSSSARAASPTTVRSRFVVCEVLCPLPHLPGVTAVEVFLNFVFVSQLGLSDARFQVCPCHTEVRNNITKELCDVEYLALTTDMWSSCNMMPYMSVTVHYVNKEWTLQSKCLQTSVMLESHTADNLEEALRHAINNWKLQEGKIACITIDNGANVAAIRQLKWPWFSCFGHNLNLAINRRPAQTELSGFAGQSTLRFRTAG